MSTEHRENPEPEIKGPQGNGTAAPTGGVAMAGNVPAANPQPPEADRSACDRVEPTRRKTENNRWEPRCNR
jgi:hypothetical protein